MMGERVVQNSRERGTRAGPGAEIPGRAIVPRPTATPAPRDEEQVALAHDLAVLLNQGLIVALRDGPEIRYVVSDGGEASS